MSIPPFFATTVFDALARNTATVLISGFWEGVVLAAASGLCLQLVPRTTAKQRFTVWMVVFTVLASLPVLSLLLANHAPIAIQPATGPHLQLDIRWSYALAALWLATVVIRSVHLLLQAVKLRSLWNSAIPARYLGAPHLDSEIWDVNRSPSLLFHLFPKFSQVQFCTSTELDRPSVIGFFSPRILVPEWLFEQLTSGELEQIVLHELEHLRRRDDWLNLLQKIGLVLFPLNPALFWIDRRLATERELACDDGVLSRTNAPRAYATCLTTLAERRLEHRRPNRLTVLALGAVGAIRRSEFSHRIESILSWRSAFNPAPYGALGAVLIAGIVASAALFANAPQLVLFSSAAAPQAVAAQSAIASHQPLAARFENVVFHPPQPPADDSPTTRLVTRKAKLHRAKPAVSVQTAQITAQSTDQTIAVRRPVERWMVLTSWRQPAPQPVLVTLPDGRTFLATYAADANQPGWLLIQL